MRRIKSKFSPVLIALCSVLILSSCDKPDILLDSTILWNTSEFSGPIPERANSRIGKGNIFDISVSPNHEWIAAVGSLGIFIYDNETFTLSHYLETDDPVFCVSWSEDGTVLIGGDSTGEIIIVDIDNRVSRSISALESKIIDIDWSHREESIAILSVDGLITIMDTASGETRLLTEEIDFPWIIDWSSGTEQIVCVNRLGRLVVFDIKDGAVIFSAGNPLDPFTFASWSPTGNRLAAGSKNNLVTIWDTKTWKEIKRLEGHNSPIWNIYWSPNAKRLLSSSIDGEFINWDTETWEKTLFTTLEDRPTSGILWVSSGFNIYGVSDGIISLWDGETGERINSVGGHQSFNGSFTVSPDDNYLAASSGEKIYIWSLDNYKLIKILHEHTGRVVSVSYSPDGEILLSTDTSGRLLFWDVSASYTLSIDSVESVSSVINSVSWSPDGNCFAFGMEDGTLGIYNTNSKKIELVFVSQHAAVSWVDWTQDGKYLATLSKSYLVNIYNVKTGELLNSYTLVPVSNVYPRFNFYSQLPMGILLRELDKYEVPGNGVAWYRDNETLAHLDDFDSDIGVYIRNGADLEVEFLWAIGDRDMTSLRWHPHKRLLASGFQNGSIDITSLRKEYYFYFDQLFGHKDRIVNLLWLSDGNTLVSSSLDGTLLIWGLEDLELLYSVDSDDQSQGNE